MNTCDMRIFDLGFPNELVVFHATKSSKENTTNTLWSLSVACKRKTFLRIKNTTQIIIIIIIRSKKY